MCVGRGVNCPPALKMVSVVCACACVSLCASEWNVMCVRACVRAKMSGVCM